MLVGYISHYIFGISIFLTSVFLIMLVLVQRGRGGGIAGALGGAGGQSAFGTKAGDLFTRITVGVATFWILLCCVAILVLRERAFTTGVTKQQARSGAMSGIGPNTDAAQKPPSEGSSSSAQSSTAESDSTEQPQPQVQPRSADQPPSAEQPASSEQSEPNDAEPEVSKLDSDNPVAVPE